VICGAATASVLAQGFEAAPLDGVLH